MIGFPFPELIQWFVVRRPKLETIHCDLEMDVLVSEGEIRMCSFTDQWFMRITRFITPIMYQKTLGT